MGAMSTIPVTVCVCDPSLDLLQKLYNLKDRQTEYGIRDNAAFQLFCGVNIIPGWHALDHTSICAFRQRISPETGRLLANLLSLACAASSRPCHPIWRKYFEISFSRQRLLQQKKPPRYRLLWRDRKWPSNAEKLPDPVKSKRRESAEACSSTCRYRAFNRTYQTWWPAGQKSHEIGHGDTCRRVCGLSWV